MKHRNKARKFTLMIYRQLQRIYIYIEQLAGCALILQMKNYRHLDGDISTEYYKVRTYIDAPIFASYFIFFHKKTVFSTMI